MKILLAHNYYRQRGGECAVFEAERRMLEDAGHDVVVYTRSSDEIGRPSGPAALALPLQTIDSGRTRRELGSLLERESPQVAHFTNTFPLISPSAYEVCNRAGVAVVQSVHNYRLVCPAATLWRDGAPCEECIDHSLARAVRHGCYRGSRAASAIPAAMLAVHRRRGTWSQRVDRYVALTEFARAKLIAGGLPPDRIASKPNFVWPDPGARSKATDTLPCDYALFAGRLAPEKGLDTLLDAFARLGASHPLRIAGDGPMRDTLASRIERESLDHVHLLGALGREQILEQLARARMLVFPSEWYEGMPMTIVEAFACGIPTVASRLGGMEEMVDDGATGLLFEPGRPADLAEKAGRLAADSAFAAKAGAGARAAYERTYTRERNLPILLSIYRDAIEQRRALSAAG